MAPVEPDPGRGNPYAENQRRRLDALRTDLEGIANAVSEALLIDLALAHQQGCHRLADLDSIANASMDQHARTVGQFFIHSPPSGADLSRHPAKILTIAGGHKTLCRS